MPRRKVEATGYPPPPPLLPKLVTSLGFGWFFFFLFFPFFVIFQKIWGFEFFLGGGRLLPPQTQTHWRHPRLGAILWVRIAIDPQQKSNASESAGCRGRTMRVPSNLRNCPWLASWDMRWSGTHTTSGGCGARKRPICRRWRYSCLLVCLPVWAALIDCTRAGTPQGRYWHVAGSRGAGTEAGQCRWGRGIQEKRAVRSPTGTEDSTPLPGMWTMSAAPVPQEVVHDAALVAFSLR